MGYFNIRAYRKKRDYYFNFDDTFKVRVMGDIVIPVKMSNITGYCHNPAHTGEVTRKILQERGCINKQCWYFERYQEFPFWRNYERIKQEKEKRKQEKKEKRETIVSINKEMCELREIFQEISDHTYSNMEIVRVERTNNRVYTIFYVSDYKYADGNRFPEFLSKSLDVFRGYRINLRHIKGVDGRFVTREEYNKIKNRRVNI